MNTVTRLVNMILRGKTDQFKTVMKEELEQRTSVLMEALYKSTSQEVLSNFTASECRDLSENIKNDEIQHIEGKSASKFIPENTYYLKDGSIGILNEMEKNQITKLYEKLNNDNKERMVKLLSESKQSFNRVLKLAKNEK